MFVKTTEVRRGNTTYRYLSLAEAFREEGKVRHRILFRLGEASALAESGELDRIIAALKAHARGVWISAEELDCSEAPAVGGMASAARYWGALGLDRHFRALGVTRRLSYDLSDAAFAMVANRLLDPCSKRRLVEWVSFEVLAPSSFTYPSLDHYYRALDQITAAKEKTESHLYTALTDLTNLNLSLVCYDLTSTYFEGDPRPSAVFASKAFGYSRDHRSDRPQVVIGLLCTGDGIPIAHHVFTGNTNDVTTLPGVLEDLQSRFGVGRICVVADRGLISETNLAALGRHGFDYILATRLHQRAGVTAVLEASTAPTATWQPAPSTNSAVCEVNHQGRRFVVVASFERLRRDQTHTKELVDKTETRLAALVKQVEAGRLKDQRKIALKAGRILSSSGMARLFEVTVAEGSFAYRRKEEAMRYEEDLLAGRYVLSTSLSLGQASPAQILSSYRHLLEIEARFRVMKDFLALRPVYHFTEARVRGHIAVCVYAAVIEALMQADLKKAGVADPDLPAQTLSARRALRELQRIRSVTLDAGSRSIEVVTRRSALQSKILAGFGVNTKSWDRPKLG